MPNRWFYTSNEQQYGPVSLDELRQLAQTGQLKPTDHVRPGNSDAWTAASLVRDLFPEPPASGPPADSPSSAQPPPGKQDLVSKAKRLWDQVSSSPGLTALGSLKERFIDQKIEGEPYVATAEARELFRGQIYVTLPRTLCKTGTKVRVMLEGDYVTIVRSVMLGGGDYIVGRYHLDQLDAVQSSPPLKAFSATGMLHSTVQIFRNTDKYGYWDGQAATNLQNQGKSPDIVEIPGTAMTFKLDDEEIGGHGYTIAQSGDTKEGSMAEAQLILKKRMRRTQPGSSPATNGLLETLKAEKAEVESRQSEVKGQLQEVRQDREKTRQEIQGLRGEIARRQAAAQSSSPDSPFRPPPPDANRSPVELLEQLAALKDAGVLSEEEFEKKKKQILDRI